MFRITEDLLQTFRDNFRSFFSRIERSSSGHRRFVTDVSGQFSVPFFKDRTFFFGSQKICYRRFGTIFGPFFQGSNVLLRITEDLLQTFRDNFRSLFSRIERSSSDHRRFVTDVSGQFSVPFFKDWAFFFGSQKICYRRFGTIFGPFFQGSSVLLRITEDLLQTFRDNFRSLFSSVERSSWAAWP